MTTVTNDSAVNQQILDKLVQREVIHCVSSLVSHFVDNPESCVGSVDYDDLISICSTPDYASAAEAHIADMDSYDLVGFCHDNDILLNGESVPDDCEDVATLRKLVDNFASPDYADFCQQNDVDTDDHVSEALEHWAVTPWFAQKLAEHGEMVGELFDFHVWGRCCSGQSISQDGVILQIAADMGILAGQEHSWE